MRKPNANLIWIAVVVAILLTSTISAIAQVSTTGISGVVQDATGAVVPNATITATQTETNYTAKTVSGATGEFTLTSLPVGPYNLTVSADTFAPYTQTGIILRVAQVSDVHVTLKAGSVAEQVTVAADQAAVQTTEATVQTVVPEQAVQDLPLNGRQTNELVFTVPGVSDATINQNQATSTTTGAGAMIPGSISPSTHGVISGSTYFALDGANNIDPYAMLGAPFPNPDATQEFNVATSAYSARYVSAPGGAVNVVSKSGTNAIHGTAFEYIRNGFFNANQWDSTAPDELKRNQFGGSLGGPILKNRMFAFGSYQKTLAGDANAMTAQLPTAAERSGSFSTADANGVAGAPITAGTLGFVSTSIVGNPFITGASPTMGNLMTQYMPLPQYGDLYKTNIASKTDTYEYIVKVDYDFGSHRVFGRYFRDYIQTPLHTMTTQDMNAAIGGKLNMFTENGGTQTFWETAAIGDTWTKSSWVVDTRASFNKGNGTNIIDPATKAVTLPSLGAQNLSASPFTGGSGLQVLLASGLTFATVGSSYSALPRETWDLSEDVTTLKGKHEITFGGSYRRMHYAEVNYAGQSGVFVYVGVTSGILMGVASHLPFLPYSGLSLTSPAIDDYVLGSPIQFIQHDGFFVGANQSVLGFYAEDKYRATPRLTLTGGVRYDPFMPIATTGGQMTCWNPGEQSTVYPNAPIGLNFPGDKGCNTSGTSHKLFNIQPRIGVAFDPTGKGKTSIRAGYGLYYMQEQLQVMLGMSNPPWIRNFQYEQPFLSIDNMWASTGTGANPFAGGFHAPGFQPPSNVSFPTTPFTNSAIASNYTPGYIQQWTLSVQQGIGTHDIVQLAYVGTKGTHLGATYDDNLPTLYTATTYAAGVSDQARRPDQSFNQLPVLKSNAISNYNALEATLTHQMQWGLYLNTSYSWSKCLSEVSSPATTQSPSNYPEPGSSVDSGASLYGLCSFDQNFAWRTNANWLLPSFSNQNMIVRQIFGKWTASGMLSIEADTPFSITDGNDLSGSGLSLDRADHSTVNPNAPVWISNAGHPGPSKRLNYAAFQDNAIGTYGNTGVNAYRDISHKDLDFALMKDFPIREQLKFSFRAEVFNLANHANYTLPAASFNGGAAAFGLYTGAAPTRVMQFAGRISF